MISNGDWGFMHVKSLEKLAYYYYYSSGKLTYSFGQIIALAIKDGFERRNSVLKIYKDTFNTLYDR
jgi:hypothetical protein